MIFAGGFVGETKAFGGGFGSLDVSEGQVLSAAAELMGLGRRRYGRLWRALATAGPTGLVSKKRGRSSNRRHGAVLRRTVLTLVREQLAGRPAGQFSLVFTPKHRSWLNLLEDSTPRWHIRCCAIQGRVSVGKFMMGLV